MIGQIDGLLYKMESDLAILIAVCTFLVLMALYVCTSKIIAEIRLAKGDKV